MNIPLSVKVVVRRILLVGGVALILLFALCWSPYPWRLYHWLSMPEAHLEVVPEWIVVLGGGGIPSESGLIRTYHGAQAAHRFPDARILVALPAHDLNTDSALRRMSDELVMRGVHEDRIHFEPRGSSTRAQAVESRKLLDEDAVLMLVTSPDHMRRAVLTFRRAGFPHVGAYGAHDTSAEGDMSISAEDVDSKLLLPTLEGSLTLRYHFWNHVGYLTRFAREFTALCYYTFKGWV